MIQDTKAWKILTDDEKMALSLKHGHGKSTWEAGEILNKAHYKYLEIQARANKFIRLFSEHFDLYHDLIPDYIPLDIRVREYFIRVISQRQKANIAIREIGDVAFSIQETREKLIIKDIVNLVNSNDVINRNFAALIFEFDRWNNFRILPQDIQEPSAFKRRNKNRDKKNLRNLINMNTYTVEQVIKRYKFHKPRKNDTILYVPIFSKFITPEKSLLRIKYDENQVTELSRCGFYIFTSEKDALDFYELLIGYDIEEEKHCKEGQKFWPKFRLNVRKAINHHAIQKIIPSRRYLESAFRDLDIQTLNPKKHNSEYQLHQKNKKKG